MYCVKCKKQTDTANEKITTTKNKRNTKRGTCVICGTTKTQFIKAPKGGSLLNKVINNLPVEMHLLSHNFTGPGTKLNKRLNPDLTPKSWSKPINRIDKAVDKFGRMSDTKTRDTGVSLTYINNNHIRSDGGTPVSGSIDMRGNTLYNVSDPVNPQDVATKEYTDNIRGVKWVKRKQDGTYAIKKDLDMIEKRLMNIPPPIEDADAVNKIYADTLSDETKRYVNSVTPFVNQQNQYTATNNINMRDFTLQNVGEPTNAKDVATKGYVDNSGGGAFEVKNGGYETKGGIYLRKNKLGGLREPVQDGEAANKRYVDNYVEDYVNDYVEKFKDENDNFVLPWKVNMAGKKLSGLSIPSKSDEAATKSYVDEAIKNLAGGDALVSKEGVFLKENGHYRATASLDIDNNKIENLPEPREDSDAATKKYVDDVAKTLTLEEALIKENGGYNIANAYINMNYNSIRNLGEPYNPADAVTKSFMENSVSKDIQKRTHVITISTNYYGDLIKDAYQFTFAGSSVKTDNSIYKGFLMPHSGYIKRFVFQCTGFKFLVSLGEVLNFNPDSILNKPIPLFTLVLSKNNGKFVELGTLNIILKKFYLEGVTILNSELEAKRVESYDYSFTSNLLGGIEKYKIDVIDMLIIRSKFTNVKEEEKGEVVQIFFYFRFY